MIVQVEEAKSLLRDQPLDAVVLLRVLLRDLVRGHDEQRILPVLLQERHELLEMSLLDVLQRLLPGLRREIRQLGRPQLIRPEEALQRLRIREKDRPQLAPQEQRLPVGMVLQNVEIIGGLIHVLDPVRLPDFVGDEAVDRADPVHGIAQVVGHAARVGHVLDHVPLPADVHPHLEDHELRLLPPQGLPREVDLRRRALQVRRERVSRDALLAVHLREGIVRKHGAGTDRDHVDRVFLLRVESHEPVLDRSARPQAVCEPGQHDQEDRAERGDFKPLFLCHSLPYISGKRS